MGDRANRWTGRALLELAAAMQRTIAGKKAQKQHRKRRNTTLRKAHKHGTPLDLMAQRMRLSEGRIRQLVRPNPPDDD